MRLINRFEYFKDASVLQSQPPEKKQKTVNSNISKNSTTVDAILLPKSASNKSSNRKNNQANSNSSLQSKKKLLVSVSY